MRKSTDETVKETEPVTETEESVPDTDDGKTAVISAELAAWEANRETVTDE